MAGLNRTGIEWCDITCNPVKGKCPMACPYCYARRLHDRFRWDPTVRYEPSVLTALDKLRKPSRVFVGSTIELFGPWVPDEWLEEILTAVAAHHQHIFIFLTKQPQNLRRFSPFPKNCWVGVTATGRGGLVNPVSPLLYVDAAIKYVSVEPLLNNPWSVGRWIDEIRDVGINWLIIGGQTGPWKPPPEQWVREIVEAADKAGTPVFCKPNLWQSGRQSRPWPPDLMRQEWPR